MYSCMNLTLILVFVSVGILLALFTYTIIKYYVCRNANGTLQENIIKYFTELCQNKVAE